MCLALGLAARTAGGSRPSRTWLAVAPSQVREKGEALGAEMDALEQRRLATLQEAAAQPTSSLVPRQPAEALRLYAAPDALRYCTTERDPHTHKLLWRELKAAAVYEVESPAEDQPASPQEALVPEDRPLLRHRVQEWAATQTPRWTLAPVDHAVRVTYVASTKPYARFGEFLWKELVDRGLGTPVRDLAVVADGSPHLDTVVDTQLRLPDLQVTRILDLPHAQQQLWALTKAIFGEGAAAGVRWVQVPLRALERGQVALLCAQHTALATTPLARTLTRRRRPARPLPSSPTGQPRWPTPPSWRRATRSAVSWPRAPANALAPSA